MNYMLIFLTVLSVLTKNQSVIWGKSFITVSFLLLLQILLNVIFPNGVNF